ncbi:MAG TPA: hypothetical protein VMB85_16295 [Bryobacteraceae bacterium]|nr:hypothetical protein [Bryobacteraceae bacterium]
MLRDVIWTFRWLRRSPLITLTIAAILALGIGANTAIFSIVDAVLLRPLPYTAANRLVRIRATSAKNPTIGISAQEYFPWRARTDLFEKTAVFAMKGESDAMSVADAVEMIHAMPPSRRSPFAREIWGRRRQRYGSTGRGGPVPF